MKWLRNAFATYTYVKDLSQKRRYPVTGLQVVETPPPDQEMADWKDTIRSVYRKCYVSNGMLSTVHNDPTTKANSVINKITLLANDKRETLTGSHLLSSRSPFVVLHTAKQFLPRSIVKHGSNKTCALSVIRSQFIS